MWSEFLKIFFMFAPCLKFCFSSELTIQLIREMKRLRMIVFVFCFMPETGQTPASRMWNNRSNCRVYGGFSQLQACTFSEEKTYS